MPLRLICLLLVTFIAASPFAAQEKQAARKKRAKRKPNPAPKAIEDDPNLPRVLLIGDSLSIGYMLPTRELLAGKANVHHILTNGGPKMRGRETRAQRF